MPPVDGFSHVHRELVRFRDLDAMGHVNNAVYLTYLEQARLTFLQGLGLVRGVGMPEMILARVEIDFRDQIGPGDEVEIGVRTARVGAKSFELEHRFEVAGRLVADARSVLVSYDYERQRSIPVPDEWRRALAPERVTA
jgi:acyl-CoA thioester hydrolase